MKFNEYVGFKLPCGVKATLQNIQKYPFHNHSDVIEIICVVDGQVNISDCAVEHKLQYGGIYIFNSGDPHCIWSEESNVVLTLHISKNYYSKLIESLSTDYFICDSFTKKNFQSSDLIFLRFLLAKIFFEYITEQASTSNLEQRTAELYTFLIERFRYYYYEKDLEGKFNIIRHSSKESMREHYLKAYQIIHDYIYENYDQPLKLQEISDKEHISVSHLSTYIKKSIGLSFSEVLSLARCEAAEKLLCSTYKTIDEIAAEVGFCNRKHLATNFKKWYRKTPTDYRKEIISFNIEDNDIITEPYDFEAAKKILFSYLDGY